MRISDWSSDVCSSDLNVAELDSEWLATLAVAAASFTRQDVNAETPICSTILPGGERCQIVIPSVTPTGAPSFTVRKPSRVTLAIDQLADSGLRSEEHTSELQSLMRISYAVFCLKKKKH